MAEWTNPLGVVWIPVVEEPLRGRYALSPRSAGVVLLAALMTPVATAPAALARGHGVDPVINLPANPAGQNGGEDDAPDGGPAPEDQPDTTTANPAPAAPATPETPIPETAPAAPEAP